MNSNRIPVSVVLLTFNSEVFIEASIRSVINWVGEIFVVDSGSEDATLDIVKRYTNNIVYHPFENYAQQRNWAQSHLPLSFDWVFHLDADEQATLELRNTLIALFSQGVPDNLNGYLIARRAIFLGRWIRHGGMYPVYHARLFRRNKGLCETRLYDQHFVVQGTTRIISGDLLDPIAVDLETWTKAHLRWAMLEAKQQLVVDSQGNRGDMVRANVTGSPIEKRRWARNVFYGKAPLFARAFALFFYRYIIRLGFLDGIEGLIFHTLQGFWFRFYVDAKIWELHRK